MNERSAHRKELETLTAFEPEEEDDDVHSACTAVAVLPDSFLDDLKRGKAEEPTTSRYKVLPDTDLVSGEAPTLPPPVQRSARVRELEDRITAALSAPAPALDMSPYLTRPPTLPEPMSSTPIEVTFDVPVSLAPPPVRWPSVALTAIYVLALASSAATIAMAMLQAC